ncbi:CheR family methyltransferase [Sediminicoccus sp. KRV36]|uniref:CheR family methyltransferase n=1 Tax=Sediminicoccus sp. KRV36 TaxID=3133721 RepID=UPI00200DC239|nr:CheR family methyltransferase [Sediminicoccus rosea]UPY38246.1 hypothetical protein LHU95_05985 [Sediminicoccus rosea]
MPPGTAAPALAEEWTGRNRAVVAALGAFAGLAPSPVLTARLRRAAHLVAACDPAAAHLDDPAWAALLDAVTVQETRLYRHPAQAELAGSLFPAALGRARAESRPLRMLSAGCATGEEAFTLAAQAIEAMAEAPGVGLEIQGLDLCRPALASAAAGIISPGMGDPLGLVPAALRPWLAAGDGTPRLHPSLRRCLDFRRANLLDGFGAIPGYDVIFCRNVLIYLTDPARLQVMGALAAALRPGGVLALGPTDRPPAGLKPLGEAVWVKPHE